MIQARSGGAVCSRVTSRGSLCVSPIFARYPVYSVTYFMSLIDALTGE